MENKEKSLTVEQYHQLYTKAFAKRADISQLTEQSMKDLGELQLTMGDK